MSSRPGLDLEDYLAWLYDLVVVGQDDPNFSLGLAEALGNIEPRPRLTQEQFKGLTDLMEDVRESVEDKLLDFDEENQSWRDYACYAFEYTFTEERLVQGWDYLVSIGVKEPRKKAGDAQQSN